MKNLAPEIHRQRLIIEGIIAKPITAEQICEYLTQLGRVLAMRVLAIPVTHQSPLYGWAGWVHWETSGAHFYAWDQPRLFFSVDIYTCKAFQDQTAIDFTKHYFNAQEIACKSL